MGAVCSDLRHKERAQHIDRARHATSIMLSGEGNGTGGDQGMHASHMTSQGNDTHVHADTEAHEKAASRLEYMFPGGKEALARLKNGDCNAQQQQMEQARVEAMKELNSQRAQKGWAHLPSDFNEICDICKIKLDFVVYTTEVGTMGA